MSDVLRDWQNYLKINLGRAASTRRLYLRNVEQLRDDMGDPTTLSTDDLRAWLHRKGGSAGTVSNRITTLKSFYGYLVKAGVRIDDPSRPLEPPSRRIAAPDQIADLDRVLALLDQTDRRANEFGGEQKRRVGESRDMAVFLAETGMRISEAVVCDWPVPCPPIVTVIGKGHKETAIAVSDAAREAWDRLDGKWPTRARATQRRFEKAGIHPHQLRHWHRANRLRSESAKISQDASDSLAGEQPPTVLDEVTATYRNQELALVASFLTDLAAVLAKRSESGGDDIENGFSDTEE